MTVFDRRHSAVSFAYFAVVLMLIMLGSHPLLHLLFCLTGMVLYAQLTSLRRLLKGLGVTLPLMLLVTLINPLFSHRGVRVLFFINDAPVTLEALLYGAGSALMLTAVWYWFLCMGTVVTSDRLIELLGKRAPRLSLLLCMTLAAVPRLHRQLQAIDEAQSGLGVYEGQGVVIRLRGRLRAVLALIGRGLESSIETADSMRARGFGLAGRTHLADTRFRASDGVALSVVLILGGGAMALLFSGAATFDYYAVPLSVTPAPAFWWLTGFSAALTLGAILAEGRETLWWKYLRSKI